MRIYVDSSALAKRYVHEPGTEAVLTKCAEATEIVVSVICLPELVSGFTRLLREELITAEQYYSLIFGYRERDIFQYRPSLRVAEADSFHFNHRRNPWNA